MYVHQTELPGRRRRFLEGMLCSVRSETIWKLSVNVRIHRLSARASRLANVANVGERRQAVQNHYFCTMHA